VHDVKDVANDDNALATPRLPACNDSMTRAGVSTRPGSVTCEELGDSYLHSGVIGQIRSTLCAEEAVIYCFVTRFPADPRLPEW